MPWILFLTRKDERTILDHKVTLNDFNYDEVEKSYRPVFIDPERKDIFAASVGYILKNIKCENAPHDRFYKILEKTL